MLNCNLRTVWHKLQLKQIFHAYYKLFLFQIKRGEGLGAHASNIDGSGAGRQVSTWYFNTPNYTVNVHLISFKWKGQFFEWFDGSRVRYFIQSSWKSIFLLILQTSQTNSKTLAILASQFFFKPHRNVLFHIWESCKKPRHHRYCRKTFSTS